MENNLSSDILNVKRKGNPYLTPKPILDHIKTKKRHEYIDSLVKIKSDWENKNLKDMIPEEAWRMIYSVLPDGSVFFMDYNLVNHKIRNKKIMTDLNQLKEAFEVVVFNPDIANCSFGLVEAKE
jgi:hypothetical protein